jgi:hypothetical protein
MLFAVYDRRRQFPIILRCIRKLNLQAKLSKSKSIFTEIEYLHRRILYLWSLVPINQTPYNLSPQHAFVILDIPCNAVA